MSNGLGMTLGTFEATPEMRALIEQVLSTGRLSYGPLCRQFEAEFAAKHGARHGILSNSGTSSLQVALQALKELHGWRDGDEVLVPALTFVATINVVYHCRLTPVLVDVEPDYYAIDPSLIERHITPRTRAIMPVHPFGQPADMDTIMEIARDRKLRVVEDSCEAMLVKSGRGDRHVGAWGDVGCFSTYIAHFITGGVGGIGICHNPDLAAKMRSLVNHGIALAQLPNGQPYDPSFLARNFRFDTIGHSFRITELEAALLIPQLAQLHTMIGERQRVAQTIGDVLSPYRSHLQLPTVRHLGAHSFMVYPIVLRHRDKRTLMDALRANGIECRDMLPLTNQPCYDFDPAAYPVSNRINHHGLYIGCHQGITDGQIIHLQEVVDEWSR